MLLLTQKEYRLFIEILIHTCDLTKAEKILAWADKKNPGIKKMFERFCKSDEIKVI